MRAARAAVAAVTFLTRVPLGRLVSTGAEDVARGAPFFPVVGAAIGAAGAGTALLLQPPLSPFLAAALATALMVAVTGVFHLDGLADTLDATGGMTRERSLEIMRDSRIGSFGAAGLALALIVRVAVVAQLLSAGACSARWSPRVPSRAARPSRSPARCRTRASGAVSSPAGSRSGARPSRPRSRCSS